MMLELYRFLYNHKDDGYLEVLLESFSICYYGSGAIHVEGIEFRAIDNVINDMKFCSCRFEEVIEVLSQQVFQKCRGLHCPVKVQGLPHQSNKETKAIYFRTPNEWNIHDINQVPKQREDGWMDGWRLMYGSLTQRISLERIVFNLKLISYEGTMCGLIVCGLEFGQCSVRIAENCGHILFLILIFLSQTFLSRGGCMYLVKKNLIELPLCQSLCTFVQCVD
ncbi:hypothetical protein Hanom_Chr16g01488831 [Helianthus anomalus]